MRITETPRGHVSPKRSVTFRREITLLSLGKIMYSGRTRSRLRDRGWVRATVSVANSSTTVLSSSVRYDQLAACARGTLVRPPRVRYDACTNTKRIRRVASTRDSFCLQVWTEEEKNRTFGISVELFFRMSVENAIRNVQLRAIIVRENLFRNINNVREYVY